MDKEKIEQAVSMIIEAIGEDPNREGLLETPQRVARMYEEIFSGLNQDAKVHLSKSFEMSSCMQREPPLRLELSFWNSSWAKAMCLCIDLRLTKAP